VRKKRSMVCKQSDKTVTIPARWSDLKFRRMSRLKIHRVVHDHSPLCFGQSSQIHLYITFSLLETSRLCVRSMRMDNVIENKNRTMPKQKGRREGIIGLPPGTATNQINNSLLLLFPWWQSGMDIRNR